MDKEVIGPVPEGKVPEEYDKARRRVLWSIPSGLYVIGSAGLKEQGNRYNLMTANLVAQVAIDPKVVAVSIEGASVTCALVKESGSFAISFVDRDDRAIVRRFVKPASQVDIDDEGMPISISGEEVFVALTGAPILKRAPAWLDCSVTQQMDVGSHVLYLGLVVDAGEKVGEDQVLNVLRMEDTRMNYGG